MNSAENTSLVIVEVGRKSRELQLLGDKAGLEFKVVGVLPSIEPWNL